MIEFNASESVAERTRAVLWRSPANFQRRIRECARAVELSQNAYITSAMLFSTIVVFGHREAQRPPDNLLRLIGEMNASVNKDENILGVCHHSDWGDVKWLIDVLGEAQLIDGFKALGDAAPETQVYSFRFTREGRDVWRAVGEKIGSLLAGLTSGRRNVSGP
ncbi:MAG TPA: hypothetical protein VII30_08895 [Gemmatimonadaceae bacterium]